MSDVEKKISPLPCPFCGSSNIEEKERDYGDAGGLYSIECNDCGGAVVDDFDYDHENWNTRAIQQALGTLELEKQALISEKFFLEKTVSDKDKRIEELENGREEVNKIILKAQGNISASINSETKERCIEYAEKAYEDLNEFYFS